jgi:dTDP-L-rhamnose 4-epimerase
MQKKKVLITGGAGFIGRAVAQLAVERGYSVRLLDNLSPQIHGAIPESSALEWAHSSEIEVLRGDVVRAPEWATALEHAGAVIHLAAETGTAQSMYEISRYAKTNVGGTAALLNHLANRKHGVRKLILASSRSVYGEGAYRCRRCGLVYPPARTEAMFRAGNWQPACPVCQGAINAVATPEDAKTAPASIYAATKLAQEDLVRIAGKALGIPAVIFRLQNVYGEGQSLKNPYTGILSIFSNQLRLGKTIQLYEDGQESRDFVHVSDVARAILAGLASDRADGETLNLGSGQPTTIVQVAQLLAERFGVTRPAVVSGRYRLGDIRHGYADRTAIRARLEFAPEIPLDQGLTRLVAWVKTQPLEPDRLDAASEELAARGLMSDLMSDHPRAQSVHVQRTHAQAASR